MQQLLTFGKHSFPAESIAYVLRNEDQARFDIYLAGKQHGVSIDFKSPEGVAFADWLEHHSREHKPGTGASGIPDPLR